MNELQRIARVRDEDLTGQASGAGARALLASIVAEEPVPEPRRRPWKRIVLATAATALLAAAAVVGPSIVNGQGDATSYANSAIDIRFEGGQWVSRIKDPFANPKEYEEAFRAVGLDVKLQLEPASPRAVGEIFQVGQAAGQGPGVTHFGFDSEPAGCKITEPGCTLVLTMSANMAGQWIKAGRPAKAGEAYSDSAGATDKDGSLQGYRVEGKTVGEVVQEIEKRGLKVVYQIVEPRPDGGHSMDPDRQSDPVSKDWFVWDAEEAQLGVVRLLVSEKLVVRKSE